MGSGGGLGLVLSILSMSVGLGRVGTPCLQQKTTCTQVPPTYSTQASSASSIVGSVRLPPRPSTTVEHLTATSAIPAS